MNQSITIELLGGITINAVAFKNNIYVHIVQGFLKWESQLNTYIGGFIKT